MEPEGGIARTPGLCYPLLIVLKTCVAPALSLVGNHFSFPCARSHPGRGFFREIQVEVEPYQRNPVSGKNPDREIPLTEASCAVNNGSCARC